MSDDPRKNRVIARLKAAGIAYSFGDTYEQLLEKLVGVKPVIAATASAQVTAANGAAAAGATPTKAEYDAVVTLANDLKAKYNVLQARCEELIDDLTA